jgi:predicted transport protein
MPAPKEYGEAERTKKWMASVEANLESATGKPLADWIKIAKKCPPGPYMSQLKWFKENHGLGTARAGLILERTFGGEALGEVPPERLVDGLFAKSFATQRPIYEAIETYARTLAGINVAPRKGYVALYRNKQFAAMKPSKEGFIVGLAMKAYPKSARLKPVKNLGGGDRTKFAITVKTAKEIDADLKSLIKAAWAEN